MKKYEDESIIVLDFRDLPKAFENKGIKHIQLRDFALTTDEKEKATIIIYKDAFKQKKILFIKYYKP